VDQFADHVAGIGALVEPARRALYLYVVAQPDAVSREQAAQAVDLPVHSAKFHLDRLVAQGLLEVEYRRLSGRGGPGAGRPSKLYRRAATELSVSLPERRYDLAAEVLASAVERSMEGGIPVAEAVREAASEAGRGIAAARRGGAGMGLEALAGVLGEQGYEPRVDAGEMCLANCPFDRMATKHVELVCGLNLALIDGVVHGLGLEGVELRLAPEAGFCCVRVRDVRRG
jgi:predicted ArsR family transcriptional regulator